MKTFTYKDELYIRCIPGKKLFNSTMVHEVVNRGDVFAIRVSDQQLTIIPGTADVLQSEHYLTNGSTAKALGQEVLKKQAILYRLNKIIAELKGITSDDN